MIESSQSLSSPYIYFYAASMVMCLYAAYCELFNKEVSDNVFLIFLGLGLSTHAFLGGVGGLFESSLIHSLAGTFVGFLLYLPFIKYYKKKYHFLFFWVSLGSILGPFHFLYVYFYTCLVCALLSLLLVLNKVFFHPSEVQQENEKNFEPDATNQKESKRIQAPYYISSIFGVLFTWLGWF